jgi:hypothetical protein
MTKFLVTYRDLEEFNSKSNDHNPIRIFWLGFLEILPKDLKKEAISKDVNLKPFMELDKQIAYRFEIQAPSKTLKSYLDKLIIVSQS